MKNTFFGWYFKCQSDSQTLAVIPAVHQNGRKKTCSIQIITESDSWIATFPGNLFKKHKQNITIGENHFGKGGIKLDIHTPELTVEGELEFNFITPLAYNIMGPFAIIPFMECRHSVYSMHHSVSGTVFVNGKEYSFKHDVGYWEGDRGTSFPKEYAWTQCSFREGALMLSVADIPMTAYHFTGVIGVIYWRGKEYRIATYLGKNKILIENRMIKVTQGNLEFEARLIEENGKPLKAPANGDMVRTVHENAASRAFYRFKIGGEDIFCFETDKASFEYEYPY